MKRKIYADLFEPAQAESLVRDVDALERSAMLGCDALLCTTQIAHRTIAGRRRAAYPHLPGRRGA